MARKGIDFQVHHLIGIGLGFILLLAALLSWNSALANPIDDGDIDVYGRIDSFPAGLVGQWVVDGVTYVADGNTQFKQEEGPFAVGKCVKVSYFPNRTPLEIREIETEIDSDCDGGTTTPDPDETETPEPDEMATPEPEETETPDSDEAATPDPDATETPEATSTPDDGDDDEDDDEGDDEDKVHGIVEGMPGTGLIGRWIIGGVEYLTDGDTEFEQNDGPFVIGACVEVEIRSDGDPAIIDEIETEEMYKCNASPTSTPEPTGTPDDDTEVYGRIDTFPTGLIGDRVVNGTTYRADAGTEFEQEHGPFAADDCVKIDANTSTSPATIREIETEHSFRCGDGNTPPQTPEAEMYGVIQSFPAGSVGIWNIGGMTFVADGSTEFDQEDGAFGIGVTVELHFSAGDDGTNRGREIETRFKTDDDDDDGDGAFEGAEGHAYGFVEAMPGNRIGEWRIGGISYMATSQTRFDDDDGDLAVGMQVKVEYVAQDSGRVALKIETTSDDGDVSNDEHAKIFGFVRAMPASGFVGDWTIDDTVFVAETMSRFEEEHGLFALGAYVSVEYSIDAGGRRIHELETHVPPGAGPEDSIGSIDDLGGDISAATVRQSTWTINGQNYQVTSATNLNDAAAPLQVGTTVSVNSYSDGSGNRVATQIRSLALDEQVFLPIVTR